MDRTLNIIQIYIYGVKALDFGETDQLILKYIKYII